GRKKITMWTRYLTAVLSALQSLGIAVSLERSNVGTQLVVNPGFGFVFMAMLTLTAGSVFIMWLGEQITERGIGNGMSLLIFAGIVAGLPRGVLDLWDKARTGAWGGSFTPIAINPNEVADNMRKYGRFVPGIRPGRLTADYINEILTRITLVGGLYLIFVSLIPQFMITGTHLNHFPRLLGGDFFASLPTWVT